MSLGGAPSAGFPGLAAEDAGPPGRPDPWTTDTVRESLRDDGRGRIVCLAPDVCLTGPDKIPTPYMVSDRCDHLVDYSKEVFHNGRRVLLYNGPGGASSLTQHVEGDEAGDGGGVKSGTNRGVCEPIDHAANYRIEGRYVVRHLDKFWMNNRNTIGEAQFQRDMQAYAAPPDDDPLPGSLRWVARDKSNDIVVADASNSPDVWVRARPAPAPAPTPAPSPPSEPLPNSTESPVEEASRWMRYGRWAISAGQAIADAGLAVPALLAAPVVLWSTPASSKQELKWEKQNLERIRKGREQKQDVKEKPQLVPSQQTQGARVSEDDEERERCGIRRHSQNPCPGKQSHHGMVDFPFRTGTQEETVAGMDNRAPGAPAYNQAYTVCLTNGMHTAVHQGLNSAIASTADVNKVTSFANVKDASFRSIDAIPPSELSAACKAIYKKVLTNQYNMPDDTPLRGTTARPSANTSLPTLQKAWGF